MKIKFNAIRSLACILLFFVILLHVCGCTSVHDSPTANDQKQISDMLDQFNAAAANSDFNRYFDFFTDDAVFIGTDATENWNKKDFMIWAKPHFDKKKTWHFNAMDRHIYFSKTRDLAWFDELLNTQMKICRGSGIVIKQGNQWKVQQYVLSMTIPNKLVDTVIKIKAPVEDELIKELSEK